jgi:hypothetical protein
MIRIAVGGAITTVIGALWALIALIFSTDTNPIGGELVAGVLVAVTGLVIVLLTGRNQP